MAEFIPIRQSIRQDAPLDLGRAEKGRQKLRQIYDPGRAQAAVQISALKRHPGLQAKKDKTNFVLSFLLYGAGD